MGVKTGTGDMKVDFKFQNKRKVTREGKREETNKRGQNAYKSIPLISLTSVMTASRPP